MRLGRRLPLVVFAVTLVAAACADVPDAPASETTESAADPKPEVPTPEAPDPGPAGEPAATAAVDGQLEVHFLDVGQGDATLLVHDDVAVLVDTGDWQRSDVVAYLQAQGVGRLDLVVVTHPHADHIGQFDQVLGAFEVDEVWWSGSTTTTLTFERAVAAFEGSDAAYEEPRAGDSTSFGSLQIDVVNPPQGVNLADLHDAGLALRIAYGNVSFLFTGDAEAGTERRMVDSAAERLAADVLQVGHHGSNTSTTPAFLEAVDPAVAIYSAGEGNVYGHPHREVLDRLAARGVEVYGTDVHGHMVVRTDGTGWTVDTQRDGVVVAAPAPAGDPDFDADPGPAGASDGCEPGQVDVNRAGLDELQQIVHIGPERAHQILDLRPFSSVSSMERITGIGPATLDDIISQGVACAS